MLNRKLGRNNSPLLKLRKRLWFHHYSGGMADPPQSADWSKAQFQMLGNDTVSDCTCAGAGNHQTEVTTAAGDPYEPTAADILAAYSAITGYDPAQTDAGGNNPTDQGANLLDVLAYWQKKGIAAHTIGAYVAVDPLNRRFVQQAIAYLEGLYIGICLAQAWLDAPQGQVWDIGPGIKPDANLGHCVVVVAYDADGVTVVTWGYLQKITWAAWEAAVDEAYAIVSDDELEPDGKTPVGFDMPTLAADLATLTA